MERVEIRVEGMTCGGCVKKATEAVSQVQGFESAEFDLEAGTASISGAIDPQAAAQAMTEAGYPSVVKSD